MDVYLFNEGKHRRLWDFLGAHVRTVDDVDGVTFAVSAPNGRAARAVGNWNQWDGRQNALTQVASTGIWAGFVPGIGAGEVYKFELEDANGHLRLKADPMARQAE